MESKSLRNGIYNFIVDNLYLSFYKKKISLSPIFDQNSFFRIRRIRNYNDDFFYEIEDIHKNYKLSISGNKEIKFIIKITETRMWSFLDVGENFFVIKNNIFLSLS